MPDPSWPRRFLDHLPPTSDRAWALGLMVALVLVGVMIGMILCLTQRNNHQVTQSMAGINQLGLESRMHALEKRVKTLEEGRYGGW